MNFAFNAMGCAFQHLLLFGRLMFLAMCLLSPVFKKYGAVSVIGQHKGDSPAAGQHILEARDKSYHFLNNNRHRRHSYHRSDRPNIILIITDDQDLLLGSMKAMPKLHRYMTQQGAYFNNSFVSTPMCCPSRSSILTGLYTHNHDVYTNNDNCSSPAWVMRHEPHTFAAYLHRAGYRTGYFGKYLNRYKGFHTPVGWDRWLGLVRNTRYYNYTVRNYGKLEYHHDNYYNDYLTDLIANNSIDFFTRSRRLHPSVPVLMVLSTPAPHGPEDAAPQYQHMFVNNTDHRTPSWNVAPNPDKQWQLQKTQPMTALYQAFTDLLQRRRLQTLQSVDDLVEKIYTELGMLSELDNTYVIFTSDHGYHLGQFGLIKGKSMAYDFDVRVPLIITGPGIRRRSRISNMASNVDLAPTILSMGRVEIPVHMDGTTLLPLLSATMDPLRYGERDFVKTDHPWRENILLERGKVSRKKQKGLRREEGVNVLRPNSHKQLHRYLSERQQKIKRHCFKNRERLQLPCKRFQKWYCSADDQTRVRLHKCRNRHRQHDTVSGTAVRAGDDHAQRCRCDVGLRESGNSSADRGLMPGKSLRQDHLQFPYDTRQNFANHLLLLRKSMFFHNVSSDKESITSSGHCWRLGNGTYLCEGSIFMDRAAYDNYQQHRQRVAMEYRRHLADLKNIQDQLLVKRPPHQNGSHVGFPAETESLPDSLDRGDQKCVCDRPLDSMTSAVHPRVAHRRHGRRSERLPDWRQQDDRNNKDGGRERKARKGKKDQCGGSDMRCFYHDDDHWRTPPFWRYYPFCFCSNSTNNIYWCLRTINVTSDFLYCEYVTNFIAYYDLLSDPHQLHNVAVRLNYGILQQLHDQLAVLRSCRGRIQCDLNTAKEASLTSSNGIGRKNRKSRIMSIYHDLNNSYSGEDYQYQTYIVHLRDAKEYGGGDTDFQQDPDFF